MRHFLHFLTLSGLVVAATLPTAVDARRLGVAATDDAGVIADLVHTLENESEEVVLIGTIEEDAALRQATEVVTGPSAQVEMIDELGSRLARDLRGLQLPKGTVAVLSFDNDAGPDNTPFVNGLPQILLTSLHQYPELTLVESHEVERGRVALLSASPLDEATNAVELGRWKARDPRTKMTKEYLAPASALDRASHKKQS